MTAAAPRRPRPRHGATVVVLAAAAAVLAGCSAPPQGSAAGASARCSAAVVQLLDAVPLFTGPQANAALDRGLPKGQRLQLCGVQGTRQLVLLPRAGQRCTSARDCASGWVPSTARTAAAP